MLRSELTGMISSRGYLDLVARVGQGAGVVHRLRGKVALAREQAAQAHGGGFHPGAA